MSVRVEKMRQNKEMEHFAESAKKL